MPVHVNEIEDLACDPYTIHRIFWIFTGMGYISKQMQLICDYFIDTPEILTAGITNIPVVTELRIANMLFCVIFFFAFFRPVQFSNGGAFGGS